MTNGDRASPERRLGWRAAPGAVQPHGRWRAALSAPFPAGSRQILWVQGPAAPSRYFPYGKHLLLLPDFTPGVGHYSASQPLSTYTKCPETGKMKA